MVCPGPHGSDSRAHLDLAVLSGLFSFATLLSIEKSLKVTVLSSFAEDMTSINPESYGSGRQPC